MLAGELREKKFKKKIKINVTIGNRMLPSNHILVEPLSSII